MGQYWLPVNLTKREFIHPHKLGTGLKLCEQAGSWPGTGAALVILCAAMPEPRGSGDPEPDPIIGRWAGDRIALVGDYAEDADLPDKFEASTIYRKCRAGEWTDISGLVCKVLERECHGSFQGKRWREWVEAGDLAAEVRQQRPLRAERRCEPRSGIQASEGSARKPAGRAGGKRMIIDAAAGCKLRGGA